LELLGEMIMRKKGRGYISIMENNNPFTVYLGEQAKILYEVCSSRDYSNNVTEYLIGQFVTREINLGWCCFYEFSSNISKTMLYCSSNNFLRERFAKYLISIGL
jgi:hypothetical protein